MTPFTLRQRLLLLSLLPSALLALVLVAYFVLSGIHALEGELRTRGVAIVRYLAPVSEYGVIAGHTESLQNLAQTTLQQSGVKAAVVVGRNGHILAVSGRVSLASNQLRSTPQEPGIIADTDEWVAFGAPVVRSLAEADALFDTAAGNSAPEAIGQVFVEMDKSELANRQSELIQRGALIITVGLLLVALMALGIADGLTRPVIRLVQAVRAMTLGQFDTRVPAESFGEFGELERGFNTMATRIAEVHQTMQERIEEATAQLAFQACHDPLTGLINRREFETRLEKAIATARAGGEESTLLFLDLDRFKPVNDLCGHLAGDELLRQISRLFQGRLRDNDTLARLGGDEFGIILANCIGSRALQVAEDICNLASAYRFIWQDKVFSISASVGLTPINRQVRSAGEVLGAGDSACCTAKAKGRNQVHVQAVNANLGRRQADHPWHDRIATALAENHLVCEALPLQRLDLAREPGRLVEIGARLDDRNAPPVPLSVLLDAAERYDLAPAIDQHLVEKTVLAMSGARSLIGEMGCLVPLSSASIRARETIPGIAAILQKHDVPAASLYLMLSEDAVLQHANQAADLRLAARDLGCRVALGDFGGGFSSFSHLRSFSPDCIKISRSLTRDIVGSRSAYVLLQAIQEIAAELGIETIAGGVEDLETFRILEKLGITHVQGKVVGPSEPLEHWLEGVVVREG